MKNSPRTVQIRKHHPHAPFPTRSSEDCNSVHPIRMRRALALHGQHLPDDHGEDHHPYRGKNRALAPALEFIGLSKGRLMGSQCDSCGYSYATPRSHCMECGSSTSWREIPTKGWVHTFTTCHYGGEAFLSETPFTLVLVEFDRVHTLFLSRLKGIHHDEVRIGLPVEARFSKTPSFKVTDIWFEPAEQGN